MNSGTCEWILVKAPKFYEYLFSDSLVVTWVQTEWHDGAEWSHFYDFQDGPGIESRLGRDSPHPSRPALGPPSLHFNGYRLSFPALKRPERGVKHPPTSIADVKERVTSVSSWPVPDRTVLLSPGGTGGKKTQSPCLIEIRPEQLLLRTL